MAIIERKPTKDGKPDPKGKSKWLVRIDAQDPETGARRQRIVGTFATKTEAKAAERDALHKRDQGTLLERSTATVADVLRGWLRSKEGSISANSVVDYRQAIDLHVIPDLGGEWAQKLTPARIQRQYDDWREAGKSARMVQRCHMVLNAAFTQADAHGVVLRNPAASVRPPRIEREIVDTWNAAEIAAFLDAAEHRPVLTRAGDTGKREPDGLWPLWPLLALEGMRRAEGLGLRWRDIDFESGTATIRQTVIADKAHAGRTVIQPRGKTASAARAVKLTGRTLEALKEHRKRQLEQRLAAAEWQNLDLIITTSTGGPVSPGGNVNRSFDAIVKAAKMPDGTPLRRIRVHDLRHSAATVMLSAGVPLKIASQRLGHATTAITATLYQHASAEMEEAAATAIDAAIERHRTTRSG